MAALWRDLGNQANSRWRQRHLAKHSPRVVRGHAISIVVEEDGLCESSKRPAATAAADLPSNCRHKRHRVKVSEREGKEVWFVRLWRSLARKMLVGRSLKL